MNSVKKLIIALVGISIVLAICFYKGCKDSKKEVVNSTPAEISIVEEKPKLAVVFDSRLQQTVNCLVQRLTYFKDTRTNQCFAFYYDPTVCVYNTLATVPCESIPEDMLVIGNVQKEVK